MPRLEFSHRNRNRSRFLPGILVLLPCLMARLLEAQVLDHGVVATNLGKGDWIYQMNFSETNLGVSTPQQVFAFEAAHGVQWIAIFGADGGDTNDFLGQYNTNIVAQAHAAGLKVFAWGHAYGNNGPGYSVQSEINAALTLLAQGADGFIINADIEYETNATRYTDAATYCQAIKAAYPHTFLAHMPFPYISGHANFPYAVFGYYCDAVMPRDYWATFGLAPAFMIANMDTEWINWQNNLTGTNVNAIKPIIPVGQGYDGIDPTYVETAADITNFIYSLKQDASPAGIGPYGGASFWDCQLHTSNDWAGIAACSIGVATVPGAPALGFQFNGAGTLILNLQGQSGGNFTIYSSTDLVSWTSVTNLPNLNGTNQFIDGSVRNNTRKFYRVGQGF